MTDTTSTNGANWVAMSEAVAKKITGRIKSGSLVMKALGVPEIGSDELWYTPAVRMDGHFYCYNPPGGFSGYAKTLAKTMNGEVIESDTAVMPYDDWIGHKLELSRRELGVPS